MRISFISLLIFLSGFSYAQTKTYVGVRAGGHVGSAILNHTLVILNIKTGFATGFHSGVFVKHFPKKKDKAINSGIQFGINYVQKGWKQTFKTAEPNFDVTMNYLEMPVEGIGYFGKKNKYFIAGGFFVEYLLSDEQSATPSDPGNVDFFTYEADRDREIGYGVRASGGIFRDFSFGSLHLEGFFTYTFSNFINAGKLVDRTPDISNLWTSGISIGYLIPFGTLDMR